MRIEEHEIRLGFAEPLTFADAGTAKKVFALPEAATLLGISRNVKTAFSAGGTLSIGASASGTEYLNAAAVTSAGVTHSDLQITIGASNEIWANIGGAVTAGEVTLAFQYALPTKRPQDY
ncbi:MAG: hypothetical protein LBO72_11050 [Helicobacteraceae bacterium]|jgi:hypothetical protein|nr:hypothetical protein [Helicobacteraceae bacterium]